VRTILAVTLLVVLIAPVFAAERLIQNAGPVLTAGWYNYQYIAEGLGPHGNGFILFLKRVADARYHFTYATLQVVGYYTNPANPLGSLVCTNARWDQNAMAEGFGFIWCSMPLQDQTLPYLTTPTQEFPDPPPTLEWADYLYALYGNNTALRLPLLEHNWSCITNAPPYLPSCVESGESVVMQPEIQR
jgi:hypothetical protein